MTAIVVSYTSPSSGDFFTTTDFIATFSNNQLTTFNWTPTGKVGTPSDRQRIIAQFFTSTGSSLKPEFITW